MDRRTIWARCSMAAIGLFGFALKLPVECRADETALFQTKTMHHLRADGPREWSAFPKKPEGPSLELKFLATSNVNSCTLSLRQQDVKQTWHVSLNDQKLGQLSIDENDMVVYFEISKGWLLQGENTLRIEQPQDAQSSIDDIRVGEVQIQSRPIKDVLNEGNLELEIVDADSHELLPARLTIVGSSGALQTTGASSGQHLAVRPGTIYTSNGVAKFGLPAGQYTIYAGRGFEYSLASTQVSILPDETVTKKLKIRREVPTPGYVACDTHVHTRTHSGHGDATVEERMITLAAEGIEMPIATDHNVNIDHRPFAKAQRVQKYFTPVIGNEVTTEVGHFNVFPVAINAKPPNHRLKEWKSIFSEIYGTPGVRVAILNHGRDLHSGVRPLGPKLHNAAVGENVKEWSPGMNAMEVINSSATQTETLQLLYDWMAFLNRGRQITPVGSSDSHDVLRHFVGQGRTYIRCDDRDPGNIDIGSAVDSFIEGRVLVSYGLLAELTVNGKYRSGDLARVGPGDVAIDVRVLGPDWVQADRVRLYANGWLIRDETISDDEQTALAAGIKWEGQWNLDLPSHDIHLVAIATGPGIDQPYWKTAKPYQSTSPNWKPQVLACSGAVWLDVDGDGRKTSAYDYATRLWTDGDKELSELLAALDRYDRSVVVQAAHLYQSSGKSWLAPESQEQLKNANRETQAGVREYVEAWRANQLAPRD